MPKGIKTGGRKKGSRNKKTVLLEMAVDGEVPLDYMLRVMRDPTADYRRRDEMARAAATFVHPRLATVQHGGNTASGPIVHEVYWRSDGENTD